MIDFAQIEQVLMLAQSAESLLAMRRLLISLAVEGAFAVRRDAIPPGGLPSDWRWANLGTIAVYNAGTRHEPTDLPRHAWLLELEDIEKRK